MVIGGRLVGWLGLFSLFILSGCGDGTWNNPYPGEDSHKNILYSSFSERPKHLDPIRSYSSNEYALIAQIYEPPLQYHYLKRPYTLVPLTATELPRPVYYGREGQVLDESASAEDIAYTYYDIAIQPGIMYQPHPAFAKDAQGKFVYHDLTQADLDNVHVLADFEKTASRELTAADYVYQIKRLAHPRLHSPILGVMSDYVVGLKEYAETLSSAYASLPDKEGKYLDLNTYPLAGAEVVDRYTYRIKVIKKYPQLLYWLAMPFFAPMPFEADRFYSQPGLAERNISLDWYPVGTGPYMLTTNNPNLRMVLERNPNFHGETYPTEGMPGDRDAGLLDDAGKPLPFVDKVVYNLEKETIPYWNKFLQGYYDTSGISSDSFDQAIKVGEGGEVGLTDDMRKKGIRLSTAVSTSTFYLGFNMLDPVIGGYDERARKLRQAISIAVDYEEFISIFQNGRGIAAQGALPPGIFGHREGEEGGNPYVYDWVNGQPQRKSVYEAKRLLQEAGYGGGVDQETGKPLVLHFDVTGGGPDDKAMLEWFRKQFKKLDIQLMLRATDYNRFREKMRKGNAQMFMWGWNADYPDPENFLFLLYGPNGKVNHHGENASNYDNPEFNRLFEQMKNMDNSAERQKIIDQMVDIARRDAPWLWGVHPKRFSLFHSWYFNSKPNLMANNSLKYKRIDPQLREVKRKEWNKPIIWPVWLILLALIVATLPAVFVYWRKEHQPLYRKGEV